MGLFSNFFNKNKEHVFTVAFYNVENLFDTKNNPKTADDDFTFKGKKRWSYKRYKRKIKNITSVISKLGKEHAKYPPIIIGLVEVENAQVVQDLIHHKNLKKHHYGYVHYDSPDERGIDVALLYAKENFEFLTSKTHHLTLPSVTETPDYTRDVLEVSGKIKGQLVSILVNHWPSRREGEKETQPNRIAAAKLNTQIINRIKEKNTNAKIIIMGDFNDDPTSLSVKKYLVGKDFYNPMESLFAKGIGTLNFKGKWNLFDQIIISKNLLNKEDKIVFKHAAVFNKKWISTHKGKFKGNPFRTYIGPWYKGGFSDHFPVCSYFKIKE